LKASNDRIEEAYFTLGKIYDQELEEPKNSIETFEVLLKRFPSTEYKPEIYYYLYLLNGKLKNNNQQEFKQKLAAEFPNSFYNKLISNPDYLSDNKKEEVLLARVYDQAYTEYEKNNIERSSAIIDSILRVHPENILADKYALLKVLISGKTSPKETYAQNLQNFITQYPESPLIGYAQQLLSKTGTANNSMGAIENNGSNENLYNKDLDNKPHYFFIIYPSATDIDEALRSDILKYNQSDDQYKNLKVELINDNTSSKILLLKEFKNKSEALAYYARFIESSDLLTKYNGINLTSFIISDDNFKTFKQNKDISTYLSFFEKSY
jgi:outer membrane protein assembly factor BamD (BamD/ComL family)